MDVEIRLADRAYHLSVRREADGHRVHVTDPPVDLVVERLGEHRFRVSGGGLSRAAWAARGDDGRLSVEVAGEAFQARRETGGRARRGGGEAGPAEGRSEVRAPMPARVVAVLVEPGAQVARDQPVVVVEAMKMQIELRAPAAGTVAEVNAVAGTLTDPSVALVVVDA